MRNSRRLDWNFRKCSKVSRSSCFTLSVVSMHSDDTLSLSSVSLPHFWITLFSCSENAFISFWGKLRKEKEGGKEGEEKVDDDEDEEDQPDLLKMAQKVDLEEVHSVLRVSRSFYRPIS